MYIKIAYNYVIKHLLCYLIMFIAKAKNLASRRLRQYTDTLTDIPQFYNETEPL